MFSNRKKCLNVICSIFLLNKTEHKMDSNRSEMYKSLIDWFKVVVKDDETLKPDHLDDLSDGVAMARALNKLATEFFTGKCVPCSPM